MIVLDASAALAALLRAGPAREALRAEALHAPHLIDAEVAHVLRRRTFTGTLADPAAACALGTWRRLGLTRYSMVDSLGRVWELRSNLTAYDACYVALAEALGCPLLTADARLAGAPGVHCPVTVLPG